MAPVTKTMIEVDAGLCAAELAPCLLVDPAAFAIAPRDEIEHRVRVVDRDVEDRQVVDVVRRNQHGKRRDEERDADVVACGSILYRTTDRRIAEAEPGRLHDEARRLVRGRSRPYRRRCAGPL